MNFIRFSPFLLRLTCLALIGSLLHVPFEALAHNIPSPPGVFRFSALSARQSFCSGIWSSNSERRTRSRQIIHTILSAFRPAPNARVAPDTYILSEQTNEPELPEAQYLRLWKEAIAQVIDQPNPVQIWNGLDLMISFLVGATGHRRELAQDPEFEGEFSLPAGTPPFTDDFPELGRHIRRLLAKHPTFYSRFGNIAPHILSIADAIEDSDRYDSIVRELYLFIGDDPLDNLLARFTEGVAMVRHIRGDGIHTEDDGTITDYPILVKHAQAFLDLVLELTQDQWNAHVSIMNDLTPRSIRFGDLMLWGVAQLLDLRIHDPSIFQRNENTEAHLKALYGPNLQEAAIPAMIQYLDDVLEGQKDRQKLAERALKKARYWHRKGLIVPGTDADWAPGSMARRIRRYNELIDRPLRDAIFNIALANLPDPHPEGSRGVKRSYSEKYGETVLSAFYQTGLKRYLRIAG